MVAETCGIPSIRMDSEMMSTEASLCLTSSWKELGNINNQTLLRYMAVFFFYSSDVVGHFGYALVGNPTPEDHAFPGEKDMPWHGVDHVLDTPDCNASADFELQPSGPIHVQSDGEEEYEPDVMSLSVFIIPSRNWSVRDAKCAIAIRMDLKEAIAFVFSRDLDVRCMFNGSPLVQVFLPILIKNHWTLYLYDLHNKRIHLLNSRLDRKKTTMIGIQQNLLK
ncbi:hypothetical protein AAG906_030851 [Vitis piasezkii]